jgi:tetratricopeptide (TPR) repeat protein
MSDKRESQRGLVVKTSPDDASVQLERLLAKQKYKDAVKQAKLIHKANPTPQNHRRLEVTYFLRAQQLYSSGMVSSAVEVARHLLEFGVTDSKVLEELPPFLVKVGLAKEAFRIQGGGESAPALSQLVLLAADQAVLHPERSQPPSPQISHEAALVRQALEALQAADEAKAFGLVRDISRSSPLSDWKLLIRGLAAFHRGDREETQANWSRLDPQRSAVKIVRQLQYLHDAQTGKAGDGPALEKLEKLVFGEPILARLRELSELVTKERWPEVIRRIPALRISLSAVDHRLAERLTASLLEPLLERTTCLNCKSGTRLLRDFMQVAEPLGIDPAWNRLWAIAWQRSCGGDPEAMKFWLKYIADLETCAALRAEDRTLAQALVWKHMAQRLLHAIDDEDDEFGGDFEDEDYDALDMDEERLIKQAAAYIERSIQLAPRHRPSYEVLLDLSKMSGEPADLAKARRRLLEVFPDDLETLIETAEKLYDDGDSRQALEVVSRARKLKPLDESLVNLEVMIRTSLARNLANQRRWDEGRAQFAAIEQLTPDELNHYYYLARKATFETKAGQAEPADRFERAAMALLPEPAPLWLSLHVESIRFKLTKAAQKNYADLLKKELKKKCRSETAGAMASLMSGYLAQDVKFDGRDRTAAEVLSYVRRTSRLNYQREDLENVVEFLGHFPKESDLLQKLVQRGLKTYPSSVMLHIAAARPNPENPFASLQTASSRVHLQEALRLAEASTRREEALLVPKIKQLLSIHEEFHSQFSHLPFGPPGSKAGSLDDFFSAFAASMGYPSEDEEDDDDDDDDDDDASAPFFGRTFSTSRRSSRGSRGKRGSRS